MWKVYVLMGVAIIVTSLLLVSGIDSMKKNHPDYRGNQDGFDDEENEEEI